MSVCLCVFVCGVLSNTYSQCHSLSLSHTHTQVEHVPTNQVMVLKVNKRLNGAKTMKEVELLKKLSHPNILQ